MLLESSRESEFGEEITHGLVGKDVVTQLRVIRPVERSRYRGRKWAIVWWHKLGSSRIGGVMTHLRQRMLEELQRRNYSPATIRSYLRCVAEFAQHFPRSPDQLGADDIRQFQLFLIKQRRLAWSSYNVFVSALRFFYVKTLKQPFILEDIPFQREPQQLPEILSQDEVARLLQAPPHLKTRAVLMTIYAAGLRISEAARLRVPDIDSARMTITIHQGKGNKDRVVMLSPVLLEVLRQYWRRKKPSEWLF